MGRGGTIRVAERSGEAGGPWEVVGEATGMQATPGPGRATPGPRSPGGVAAHWPSTRGCVREAARYSNPDTRSHADPVRGGVSVGVEVGVEGVAGRGADRSALGTLGGRAARAARGIDRKRAPPRPPPQRQTLALGMKLFPLPRCCAGAPSCAPAAGLTTLIIMEMGYLDDGKLRYVRQRGPAGETAPCPPRFGPARLARLARLDWSPPQPRGARTFAGS